MAILPTSPAPTPRRPATTAATRPVAPANPLSPQRLNKVLQSGHAPAQLSLFLRPSGAR
jgi:hypothetical protein